MVSNNYLNLNWEFILHTSLILDILFRELALIGEEMPENLESLLPAPDILEISFSERQKARQWHPRKCMLWCSCRCWPTPPFCRYSEPNRLLHSFINALMSRTSFLTLRDALFSLLAEHTCSQVHLFGVQKGGVISPRSTNEIHFVGIGFYGGNKISCVCFVA